MRRAESVAVCAPVGGPAGRRAPLAPMSPDATWANVRDHGAFGATLAELAALLARAYLRSQRTSRDCLALSRAAEPSCGSPGNSTQIASRARDGGESR